MAREARVGGERSIPQNVRAEAGPLALVLDGDHHPAAVAHGVSAVGRDHGVAEAGARRRLAAALQVQQRHGHPVRHAVEERNGNAAAAPGAVAAVQRPPGWLRAR